MKRIAAFLKDTAGITSVGDLVNGYWHTSGDKWSKDANPEGAIGLAEVCSLEGISLQRVETLLRHVKELGAQRVMVRGNEVYFLLGITGITHIDGSAFYAVNSTDRPNALGGQVRQIDGAADWWVMQVD